MNDLRKTIAPKSDQLNADDLIGLSKTIKITKVSILAEADQPVSLNFEGDNGKPFKPCKSMRRVLVNVWGGDGNSYIGRSMTLYRDDKVMFGGVSVGGIRISHMSHIDKEITMALTATRASRKPFTVKPMPVTSEAAYGDISEEAKEAAKKGTAVLQSFWGRLTPVQKKTILPQMPDLKKEAAEADAECEVSEDPFGLPPIDETTQQNAKV